MHIAGCLRTSACLPRRKVQETDWNVAGSGERASGCEMALLQIAELLFRLVRPLKLIAEFNGQRAPSACSVCAPNARRFVLELSVSCKLTATRHADCDAMRAVAKGPRVRSVAPFVSMPELVRKFACSDAAIPVSSMRWILAPSRQPSTFTCCSRAVRLANQSSVPESDSMPSEARHTASSSASAAAAASPSSQAAQNSPRCLGSVWARQTLSSSRVGNHCRAVGIHP